MTTAADPTTQPKSSSPVDAHASPVAETKDRSGKATAAMVLGITGVLAAFLVAVVGLILGVIAIVFGHMAKAETASGRKSGRSQAQAGFVLGILAVAASIISMIVAAAILAS